MRLRKVATLVVLGAVGTLGLIIVGGLSVLSIFSPGPRSLGATGGKLSPCPPSPNCVCSQSTDAAHYVEAIAFRGDGRRALTALTRAIEKLPRTRVVAASDSYVHVEFRSLVFRFVDDVELLLDEKAQAIQVRSASRAGHSDLGVNRRRVEQLRALAGAADGS